MGARSRSVETVSDDARTVLDSIRRIVRELRVASREAEKRAGLSSAQLFVLQKLASGRALSLNELAARTFTHQSSVSVVVQKLADRGLVVRAVSPQDGRQIELSLSPEAKKLIRKWPEAAQHSLIEAIVGMPAAQRRQLAESLSALCKAMGIADKTATMLFEDENSEKKIKGVKKATSNEA